MSDMCSRCDMRVLERLSLPDNAGHLRTDRQRLFEYIVAVAAADDEVHRYPVCEPERPEVECPRLRSTLAITEVVLGEAVE